MWLSCHARTSLGATIRTIAAKWVTDAANLAAKGECPVIGLYITYFCTGVVYMHTFQRAGHDFGGMRRKLRSAYGATV